MALMLTSSRHRAILARLRADGEVQVPELAQTFGVSESTIRRDLDTLGSDGLVLRVRGGARAGGEPDDDPFGTVVTQSAPLKEAVAARAAELVRDGDVVLLDIGTTTSRIARRLAERRITVITSSLAVVDELRESLTVDLVILGGAYRRSYLSLVGTLTENALAELRATVCFLSTSGVSSGGQVMDTTGLEVPVKRAMLAASERRVLVADRDKFPGSGLLRVAGPEEFTTIITNAGATPATLARFTEAGTEVITA